MKYLRRNKNGLTFIEMLITVAIVGVIGIVLFSVLSNGLDLWQVAESKLSEEDVVIFFDKTTKELKNSFPFLSLDLQGNQTVVSFATVVSLRDAGDIPSEGVGWVRYSFNEEQKALSRTKMTYSQLYDGRAGESSVVFRDLEGCTFSYFYYDQFQESFFWGNEWPIFNKEGKKIGEWPFAIKMELVLTDEQETLANYQKIIWLPLGK